METGFICFYFFWDDYTHSHIVLSTSSGVTAWFVDVSSYKSWYDAIFCDYGSRYDTCFSHASYIAVREMQSLFQLINACTRPVRVLFFMQLQSPEWFLHGSPWVPVCDVTTINLYLELIKPAIVQLGLLSDSGQRRFLRGEISTHATRRVWIWQLYWRYVGEHESGLNRGKELDGIGWCAWLKWVAWSDEFGMNCKQHQVVAEPPNRGVVYWGCAMISRWL